MLILNKYDEYNNYMCTIYTGISDRPTMNRYWHGYVINFIIDVTV